MRIGRWPVQYASCSEPQQTWALAHPHPIPLSAVTERQMEEEELSHPLAHYWIATSHNSYLVGNQLTGFVTADAYRRQLLQGDIHTAAPFFIRVSAARPLLRW